VFMRSSSMSLQKEARVDANLHTLLARCCLYRISSLCALELASREHYRQGRISSSTKSQSPLAGIKPRGAARRKRTLLAVGARRFPTVGILLVFAYALFFVSTAHPAAAQSQTGNDEVKQLKQMVLDLQSRVTALESQNAALMKKSSLTGDSGPDAAAKLVNATLAMRRSDSAGPSTLEANNQETPAQPTSASAVPANLPGGATLNYMLDGYYEYNFNRPPGGVNDVRAYDVLSNAFSINQADVIFALDPDVAAKRRYGVRLDLQFGQATETLQGNPVNEPRPEIYRNIFQAYGTYVVPIGRGLNIDVGKWASSLGAEGNYTKDQMNYTRSFYFYFLPFYHQGVRAQYHINDKLAVNYWLVNGTNQSEPTNQYKDELFGYVLQPTKSLAWTVNY
jgi:hypothetical protein